LDLSTLGENNLGVSKSWPKGKQLAGLKLLLVIREHSHGGDAEIVLLGQDLPAKFDG
jgi:hypothetical protein